MSKIPSFKDLPFLANPAAVPTPEMWRKTAESGGFFLREEPVRQVIQIRLFADSLNVDADLYGAGESEDRDGI